MKESRMKDRSNPDENKAIEFRNPQSYKAWFDALEPAMQRVVLAEEALAIARAQIVIPHRGDYWRDVTDPKGYIPEGVSPFPQTLCTVCQLGGLFASWLKIEGSGVEALMEPPVFKLPGLLHHMKDRIRQHFSPRMLTLIESAFEKRSCQDEDDDNVYDWDRNRPISEVQDAIDFGKRYDDDSERYEAILCNIIHHHGEFVPTVQEAVLSNPTLPVNGTALNETLDGEGKANEREPSGEEP